MSQINPSQEGTLELELTWPIALSQYLQEDKTLYISLPQDTRSQLRARIVRVVVGQTILIRPIVKANLFTVRLQFNQENALRVRMAVANGVLCFETSANTQPQHDDWTIALQWPEHIRIEQSRNYPRVALQQAILLERSGDLRRRAMMLNLSEKGMQVEYHAPLGQIGEELKLLLVLPFDAGALTIEAKAVIRSKLSEISEDHVLHGLEFTHLSDAAAKTIHRYMLERLMAQNEV